MVSGLVRVFLFVLLLLTFGGAAYAQDSLRGPNRVIFINVELINGHTIHGRGLEKTIHDELRVTQADSAQQVVSGRDVQRVTFLSTPLEPPTEIPWDDIPMEHITCLCCELNDGPTFTEVHLGGTYRGNATYLRQTAKGVDTVSTHGFGSMSADGSVGTLQLDLEHGWRVGKWRLGAFVGLLPSDGAWFIPAGFHVAYEFRDEFLGMCPQIFTNIGIPFDFQTGAPIFFSKFDRTRKFINGGFALERPFHGHTNWSFQLGAEYVTLPLPKIDCCPGLPNEDHYPTRSWIAIYAGIGFSF